MLIKIGYNPNLCMDIKNTLELDINKDEIQQVINGLEQTLYHRLVTLIDRLEFIEHLKHVKKEALHNAFKFDNIEVNGIDNDIDALRIYLIMTCIDIFSHKKGFQTFNTWLVKNCEEFYKDTFEEPKSFETYIANKYDEYRK